jgi:cAMP-specific phosphodiesterase 4
MMEMALHSSDISYPGRDFKIVSKWVYLLFEEFFAQGDLEKDEGLPISMFCDRTTVNIPKSQPGFLNGIILPLWNNMVEIMPPLK